jgi:hypothetical protein
MGRRRLGIAGVKEADWGEHICVLFHSKDELLQLTVPYIKSGLEDNEFCMWITGEPVTEADAFQALEEVLPNVQQYLEKKQLEILPYTQWYIYSGIFNHERVIKNWLFRAKHALGKGFEGVRITGNPCWLDTEQDWERFRIYEETITQNIRNERVLALCTYPKNICQIVHVMQMLSSHASTLLRQNEYWERHTIPEPYTRHTPLR